MANPWFSLSQTGGLPVSGAPFLPNLIRSFQLVSEGLTHPGRAGWGGVGSLLGGLVGWAAGGGLLPGGGDRGVGSGRRAHSPRSRFMSTSWPASVLLFTRQRMVPPDPGDAVARDANELDHGAGAGPGRGAAGAHPQPLGHADVDGQQGVEGDALEGGVQLHAVLLGQLLGLAPLAGPIARGWGLCRGARGLPARAAGLRGPLGGLVQGQELRPVEDIVAVPGPGAALGGWHGAAHTARAGAGPAARPGPRRQELPREPPPPPASLPSPQQLLNTECGTAHGCLPLAATGLRGDVSARWAANEPTDAAGANGAAGEADACTAAAGLPQAWAI